MGLLHLLVDTCAPPALLVPRGSPLEVKIGTYWYKTNVQPASTGRRMTSFSEHVQGPPQTQPNIFMLLQVFLQDVKNSRQDFGLE